MNRRALSLVLVAMSMAGCANYSGLDTQGTRLDAGTLQTGKTLSGVTLSSAAWPSADWWKSLGDPQLDGLIQEALQNSPDMQVASARAHQAEAAAYAANAERMPTLDASAGVTRSRLAKDQDPRGEGDAYSTVRNIGASFNYNFDLWGGQRAAWEAALGEARAAQVDQQAARLTLAANVAKAYSDLGQAHIVRDLANDDLKLTALGDFCQHAVELHVVAAGGVVEFDEFAAFGQGETDTLAPQDQLEAHLVPRRVDALLAPTLRGQQALFFIEANGTGGDVELAGEVGDAVGGAHGWRSRKSWR